MVSAAVTRSLLGFGGWFAIVSRYYYRASRHGPISSAVG
jgi:hypothetical protein